MAVHPDADVVDHRRVPRLEQIGGAGEQHEAAVGAEIEALEIDVAERVVAGQPVHALLAEAEQAVEPAFGERPCGAGAALGQFIAGEMQRHGQPLSMMAETLRP